jgi:hypothetical protein
MEGQMTELKLGENTWRQEVRNDEKQRLKL